MISKETKTLSRTLTFEESGETLTLTITLVDVSPQKTKAIQDVLSTMFSNLIKEI